MRRLTDVTITSADRPAPPRGGKAGRTARAAGTTQAAPRTRRRRATPLWWKRTRTGLAIAAAAALLIGGPYWLARSGTFGRAKTATTAALVDLSVHAGLRVDEILVDGRKRVPPEALLGALGIQRGDAILGVDLTAARQRVAALAGIKSVTIERRLPGELHVLVTEREPIAIWQNDGRYSLVDGDGMPAGDNIDDYPGLPLVVGAGAPDHVAALLEILAGEQELKSRVKASQWVSGQRWNIVMTGPAGDIEVRLPEDNPAAAWHELARIEAEQKLLERKVAVVDMRLPDRLVLRIPGGIEQPAKSPTPSSARRMAPGRDA
jgi:cell division protein FtsQ